MREMWNRKFNSETFLYGLEANNFIKTNYPIIPKNSKILCLGEGEGRNALFLAQQGFDVTALDASDVGLNKVERLAKEHHVDIHLKHLLISQWEDHDTYDAIASTYMHLHANEQKEMFQKIITALRVGGYFIAEFFSTSQLNFTSGGPKNVDLLYRLDSLYQIFSALPCEIYKLSQERIFLQEGPAHNGEASVIRIIIKKIAAS
ncbi:class I SAM-dependent methyltransferase [Sulfurospirillum sp. 1612]|uniref:class I SAM-dependent methyltransferase n=1 Tax=Sulfurospirillum sp. 1612 TaxID=3094835 RepID=UPI002F91CDDC